MTPPLPADDLDLLSTPPERIVLTVDEVANILRVHPSTVTQHFNIGKIGGFTMGRRILITQADVDAFIARGRASCPAAANQQPEPTVFRPRRTA